MEALGRTTFLAGVNMILRSIGEREVSNIVDPTRGDVSASVSELNNTTTLVLSEGWDFNREVRKLSPDEDGRIKVPLSALSLGLTAPFQRDEIVARGDYFFNKTESTYQFTEPIEFEIIVSLSWDELPENTRQYIIARAARRVASDRVGDVSMIQQLGQDETRTRILVDNAETEQGNYSMNDSPIVRRINSQWLR